MKTLLIDIGGIFFYPTWRLRGVREVGNKLSITEENFKKALKLDKKAFYTGKITEEKYWENILAILGIQHASPTDLERIYRTYVTPIPETLALLPHLSARYKLISCNNSSKEWMDYRIKIAHLETYFSDFFTSGYLGFKKPDDEMYMHVLKFCKNNTDLLYIDDNEDYISVAHDKFGIKGSVYKSIDDLRALIT